MLPLAWREIVCRGVPWTLFCCQSCAGLTVLVAQLSLLVFEMYARPDLICSFATRDFGTLTVCQLTVVCTVPVLGTLVPAANWILRKTGGRHGLWTRCFALVTGRSTADHHFASFILASLIGRFTLRTFLSP